jgi:DNA repair protein RecO (recombination protein O)
MLETAERLTETEREPARAAVPAAGRRAADARRGEHDPASCSTRTCCARWRSAGWAPSFSDCARCGAPGRTGPSRSAVGGSVCPRAAAGRRAAPGHLDLLAALLSGDWAGATPASSAGAGRRSGLVAAYLQWHLERQVRSLRLVER